MLVRSSYRAVDAGRQGVLHFFKPFVQIASCPVVDCGQDVQKSPLKTWSKVGRWGACPWSSPADGMSELLLRQPAKRGSCSACTCQGVVTGNILLISSGSVKYWHEHLRHLWEGW